MRQHTRPWLVETPPPKRHAMHVGRSLVSERWEEPLPSSLSDRQGGITMRALSLSCPVGEVTDTCSYHSMPRKRPQTQASSINDLPPCTGPKLHQFQHHRSPIRWMERLDEDGGDGSSAEAYVFRAIIRKKQYAIKVVRTASLYKIQVADLASSNSVTLGALNTTGAPSWVKTHL